MDALNALGLAYEDSDDEEPDSHPPPQVPVPQPGLPPLPAVSLPPLATAALPDAGALGLPDEGDWDDDDDEDAPPIHDRVGTSYNAVAVPTAISSAADEHNYKATRGAKPRVTAGAAVKEALASIGSIPGSSAIDSQKAAATTKSREEPLKGRRSSGSSGLLLPPQLSGRRNVTTEELSNMRTAKRQKPS